MHVHVLCQPEPQGSPTQGGGRSGLAHPFLTFSMLSTITFFSSTTSPRTRDSVSALHLAWHSSVQHYHTPFRSLTYACRPAA
jgi:hypothetical protein